MPDQVPEPTEQDKENAALREAIAARQNAEFEKAQALADRTLGPGYTPWMRLDLIPSDHHQTADTTPVATAYKVCKGDLKLSEKSFFLREMPGGLVQVAESYEPLFGDLLDDPHPTRKLELLRGEVVAAPRWTLVWRALELYHPKDAEQLAALRVSREAGKTRRADAKFAEKSPLLSQAGIRRKDVEDEPEGTARGR